MVNPFELPYNELEDDDDKALIDAATAVLENGDRLYSSFGVDDISHITWTISQVLHVLKMHGDPASVYLEISNDDEGYSISLITIDNKPES